MCQIIKPMTHETDDLETLGDVRALTQPLVTHAIYARSGTDANTWPDDSCLCPVDIPATFAGTPYRVELEDDGHYYLEKKPEGDV